MQRINRKKGKRLFCFILVFCLLCSFIPTSASASTATVTTETDLINAIADSGVDKIEIAGDIALQSEIEIDRSITFAAENPGDKVKLIAENSRHFEVRSSTIVLRFENVILDGGDTGGGIFSENSTLTLEGIEINHCAFGSPGGAVQAVGSALIIQESNFHKNFAPYNGGAIYLEGSSLNIDKSNFSENVSPYNGGAIYGDADGSITIKKSNFTENISADEGGGAIYAESELTISESNFTGNKASFGGAIGSSFDSKVSVEGSTFTGNAAVKDGGGICSAGGVITIENSGFSSNKAGLNGGAIFGDSYAYSPNKISVLNSGFFSNTAVEEGGGIWIDKIEQLKVDGNTEFGSNTAELAFDYGIGNKSDYPEIDWASVSLAGTHVLNNYDIVYTVANPIFVVTFDAGLHGTMVGAAMVGVEDGGFVTDVPTVAAEAGYAFIGWKSGETGNTYDDSGVKAYMVQSDVTFTARYEKIQKATVVFDFNGGADSAGNASKTESGYPGDPLTIPANPTRTGYTFTGWDTPPPGTFGAAGSETAFKAQWAKNSMVVTYDPNGGDGTAVHETVDIAAHTVLENENSKLGFTKEQYVFAGWSTDPKAEKAQYGGGEIIALTGNLTLYAVWEIQAHQHYAYIIGYPDGTIRPNQNITREEVSAVILRILEETERKANWETTNAFPDVADTRWSNNAISTLAAMGIVKGYPNGGFKPAGNITRAEFATMLIRLAGLDDQTANTGYFPDVKGWAANSINLAYENNLVVGYEDGTFRANNAITRAEAMAMINRLLGRKVKSAADLLPEMKTFKDNTNAEKWYYLEIQEATNSHFCVESFVDADGTTYEQWTKLSGTPNWLLLNEQGVDIQNFVYPKN